MRQPLRDYQSRAVSGVLDAWATGARAVCLVAPTGAGKTRLAEEFLSLGHSALFLVHRRELLKQARERFQQAFGDNVGIIAAGHEYQPGARIQVATVQTLLAREVRPTATLVIFDEAHHYVAEDWRELAGDYAEALLLGLTATPERSDGLPLGDLFERLVVAASYSELVQDGFLVDARVYQPPSAFVGDGLAQDPVVAYERYAEGSRAFLFCSSVKQAMELAEQFCARGIPAETVDYKTHKGVRLEALARFTSGETRVLCNVYALTEGVDVPAARTCILARNCEHVGMYLQMVGRVLRPHPEKADAIVIDLTGATLTHGMPTEDRLYALTGEGIRRESIVALRNCPRCGATVPSAQRTCPECSYFDPPKPPKRVRVYDLELERVYDGANTPLDAKSREYRRLRAVAQERGWSVGWVVREYRKLFKEQPPLGDVSRAEARDEFDRLRSIAAKKGYKPTFASVRFKDTFGRWPDRSWL